MRKGRVYEIRDGDGEDKRKRHNLYEESRQKGRNYAVRREGRYYIVREQ